ncbi:hypothetical protein ABIB25_005940 [Nakamurella sp. UYEF19]|uniref:HNH endonuclease signature motif containing protein n=1 Tax=Nakamurella sp. UYEF19 TaxID=1756392 RepID=UPI003395F60D
MWTTGVAFGQHVVMLIPGAAPTAPPTLLLPGEGASTRARARSAALRPAAAATTGPGRGRAVRRTAGRTLLTPPGAGRELLLPGQPDRAARIRREWLHGDPDHTDIATGRRLGLFGTGPGRGPDGSTRAREMLGDLGYWQSRITACTAATPTSELAALLEERPDTDQPTGPGIATGLGSLRAHVLLDSLAARQQLINALQGDQYADAAALAHAYPANQEFLAAELAVALTSTQTVAAALLGTGFALTTRLRGTLAALQAGTISKDIADVIVGASTPLTDPELTGQLETAVLPKVAGRSREWVRREVNRHVIRLDPAGADERHDHAKKQRRVSKWADLDGMGHLTLTAPLQDIAAIWETLTGLADAARHPDDPRNLDQRRADVFIDIFHTILRRGGLGDTPLPTQHGRRPQIGVLIPYDLLHAAATRADHGHCPTCGHRPTHPDPTTRTAAPAEENTDTASSATNPAQPNVSEIIGYGPISNNQALTIAADGTWRRLVCDPLTGLLLDYGTTRYEPPEALKQFIIMRDQTCTGFGCNQPGGRCEIDHATAYSTGGPTNHRNLSPQCKHDHRSKDGGGFHLTIHPDNSTTWTTPLGRSITTPPHQLIQPTPPIKPTPPPTPAPHPAPDPAPDPDPAPETAPTYDPPPF